MTRNTTATESRGVYQPTAEGPVETVPVSFYDPPPASPPPEPPADSTPTTPEASE